MKSLSGALTCVLCFLCFACYMSAGAKRQTVLTTPQEEQRPLALEIAVDKTTKLAQPLRFNWKISNPGAKPVKVFSTLLEPQNNDFAEVTIDAKDKVLSVGFLRSMVAVGFPPYSFPKLEFKQIDPGIQWTGTFLSDAPINWLRDYRIVGKELDEIMVTPGTWRIRSAVAYGYELESVRQAIKESLDAGQEHPINAVVKWQTVGYSAPILIELQK